MYNEIEKALQINYELRNYDIKFCSKCLQPIEEYQNIAGGLCRECKEDY